MKKILFYPLLFLSLVVAAQPKLDKTSTVKDKGGMVYPYGIWSKLLQKGTYTISPVKDEENSFLIRELTPQEIKDVEERAPKPQESPFFKTGEHFKNFKTRDIENKKLNTKDLAGKVLVLNFWFINCPPCRMEIPELSKLSMEYKQDSGVVFIAIGLDPGRDIENFTKSTPFSYRLIDDGRSIADVYGIKGYPTNVVVDKNGQVYFHSAGYGRGTIPWLRKSIEACKKGE